MKDVKYYTLVLFLIALLSMKNKAIAQEKPGFGNYVSDSSTAISIAEAIWVPIFGKEVLNKKPYRAKLVDNKYWVVKGTLNEPKSTGDTLVIVKGGVPYIEIRKSDCKIMSVGHSK